ncbi:MAG: adenylate/guanylate cyclase domain-containing protein [Aestuariivirga sp.]|uniref:adenylate/guanylate cyclase domain-containing protein n=1 Tax=Aestuariivirga sp. TaxID=2650926 RepID=UPI003018A140
MIALSQWLRDHGLEQHLALFEDNEIDFTTMLLLTEKDLVELGLSFGARKRLLAALMRAEGAPVVADDEQRRQLTVLFCDVVGYTKLAAELDPEILTDVVRGYEDWCAACVARYEGYLFQRMGDGIVAFFGYPLAHEREAERAIRAGLDILDGVRNLEHPLDLRIGIATGIVVVSSGGRMAVGDAMNLAARLQATAQPGEIAVSSIVRKLAGSAFSYAPLGDVELKGFPQPVPAFRVEEQQTIPADQAGVPDQMPVGRETELGVLGNMWLDVCEQKRGRIAGICGEPGIGKSRLATDLCAQIVTPENRLIRFQCSPFHMATPLYPVIAHFESTMGFTRGMAPEERLNRIEALVCGRDHLPTSDVRFIAALMSVPFVNRFGAITEPPRIAKAETLRILIAMIASACADAPAIMLFEDLHWADPTTLEGIDLVVSRLATIPVFMVTTYRPEFAPRWSGSADGRTITLPRLSPEQSFAMIRRCAGGMPMPPAIEGMIVEKTDGVPLFIEELTHALIESGQLAQSGDRFVQASGTVIVSLPDSLRGSLTARLDKLVKAKRVAQIGAVVGRSFSREFLRAIGIHDMTQLDEGLAQLVESGLAHIEEGVGTRSYVFKHALVQDAAYDSLLLSQRKNLHNKVAELLTEHDPGLTERQPELVAHHLSAAGADARAVPLWLKAAEIAMQRFAINEAASHLRRGLLQVASLPPGEERNVLELRYRAALAPVLVAERGWGHPELSAVLEPAWMLASSLRHSAAFLPILNALWVHYMSIDKLSLSLNWAERAREIGEAAEDGNLTIVAHRALARSYYWQGDFAKARQHGDVLNTMYDPQKHWHVAEKTNTDPQTGEWIYRGQYLWMMGYPHQAVATCNMRDEHARRRGHPFDMAFSLTLGAQVYEFLNLPGELERRADEASAMGRRFGVPLFFDMMCEISRGVAWLRAGRFEEAAAQIERAVARLASTGHRVWLPYLLALRGEALARLGHTEAAARQIDQCIERIEQGEQRCHFAQVLRLSGWLHGLEGDRPNAERLLHRAIGVARAQEAKSWELRAAMTLAELLERHGETEQALVVLQPVYDWFTEGFDTNDLQAAARILARLANSPTPRAPVLPTAPDAPAAGMFRTAS